MAWMVPTALLSSAATEARTTSPRKAMPARLMARVARMHAVTPAFMLKTPWPKILPSAIQGVKGSRVQPLARGSMSMCPLSMMERPPPGPGEPGHRLFPPGLDLLQLRREALVAEVVGEPLRARRLLGGEGGNADQVGGEADDLLLVDPLEDLLLDVGQGGAGHGRADSSLVGCPRSIRGRP